MTPLCLSGLNQHIKTENSILPIHGGDSEVKMDSSIANQLDQGVNFTKF
jgi:hypothetical protein